MQKLTIGEITFDVIEVDETIINLENPLLLITDKQQALLFKELVQREDDSFNILNHKISENEYACNALKNYLVRQDIDVKRVLYIDGFLKITFNGKVPLNKALDALRVPYAYVYTKVNGAIIIDLEEYEKNGR